MPYKVIKNENGTYNIERVPVFRLGNIRGYEYDSEWGQRMLSKMASRAGSGYFPPVIFGHGGQINWGEEKPAIGFMKNFGIDATGDPSGFNDTVYCDLCEIGEAAMNEIKALKYPYRSVEVWPEMSEITAVALLGATEPYWKFPRLEIEGFAAEGRKDAVLFNEYADYTEAPDPIAGKDEGGLVSRIVKAVKEALSGEKKVVAAPKAGVTFDNDNDSEHKEDEMSRDEFKTKYGMYPEEMQTQFANANARAEKAEGELVTLKARVKQEKVDRFCQDCLDRKVMPAMTEKFKAQLEKSDDVDSLIDIFTETIKQGKEAFTVPTGEDTAHAEKKIFNGNDDNEAMHSRIQDYQKKHSCSYTEAASAVAVEMDRGGAK